jgi:transcriptional regulator with XRE-family HTH domain
MLLPSQPLGKGRGLENFSALTVAAITIGYMSLAARVRDARTAAGLSQSELSRRIHLKPSAVNHIEGGRTKALKAETILALAQTLSVSAYWLETGKGSPSPDARLSPEEAEVLSLHRLLSPANRDAWLSVGRTLHSAQPSSKPSAADPFRKEKRVS